MMDKSIGNSLRPSKDAFESRMFLNHSYSIRVLLLVVTFGVIFLQGCKKNEDNSSIPDNSTDAKVKVDLVVLTVDEQGNDLAGVSLKVSDASGVTDQFGSCVFKDVMVPSARYYVSADKSGYFSAGYGGLPGKEKTHYIRITLLSKGSASVFNSITTGLITTPDNAQINIPANSVKYSDGTAYSGQVKVYTRMLNQDDAQFSTLFPGGDLASLNGSGELEQLESYGMLGVELEDASGNKLNLGGAANATIRIPIASSQISGAPDSIPLLHFDEEQGVWIQDGYASRNGSFYIGTVSHFSWWNCDVPLPTPTPIISGRVVDCIGNPVPGCVVSVNNIYTLITNSQGEYSSWIPAGINVVVSVNPQLNSGIYPAMNSQSVFIVPGLNLVPDIVISCPASISGQAVDCQGVSTAAYVRALWPNGSTMLLYFPNGNFQISVLPNQSVQLTIFNSSSFQDTIVTSSSFGSNLNIGNISLCSTPVGPGCSGTSSVTDIDGNTYNVVSIGGQCWMAENLKTTKYRNGTPIATGLTDTQWNQTNSGAYATYNNLPSNVSTYGQLYNWYAVTDVNGLCPTGWHVPTDTEWDQMTDSQGGQPFAGGHMKTIGTIQAQNGLWQSPNTAADNLSGFSGYPGGYRNYDGSYAGMGTTGYWASSSTANLPTTSWFRVLGYDYGAVVKNENDKRIGFSVRCIKD
jgi:uncharacterized protein (TIGR02145 family)